MRALSIVLILLGILVWIVGLVDSATPNGMIVLVVGGVIVLCGSILATGRAIIDAIERRS